MSSLYCCVTQAGNPASAQAYLTALFRKLFGILRRVLHALRQICSAETHHLIQKVRGSRSSTFSLRKMSHSAKTKASFHSNLSSQPFWAVPTHVCSYLESSLVSYSDILLSSRSPPKRSQNCNSPLLSICCYFTNSCRGVFYFVLCFSNPLH